MATVKYYFNAQSGGNYVDSDYAVDDDPGLASRAISTTNGNAIPMTSNSCPGDNLGTIAKVEIRYYGYCSSSGSTGLQPRFNGATSGTLVNLTTPVFPTWDYSAWADITTDSGAPSPWTWSDVKNLDLLVQNTQSGSGNSSVFIAEVQVTYTVGTTYIPRVIIV
jgi:hypothetical protein